MAESKAKRCLTCGGFRRAHVHNEKCPYRGRPGEFRHHPFIEGP